MRGRNAVSNKNILLCMKWLECLGEEIGKDVSQYKKQEKLLIK